MHNERHSSYLFFLGREAEIAFAELSAALKIHNVSNIHRLLPTIAIAAMPDKAVEDLAQTLAGTVKIAYILEDHAKFIDQVRSQKTIVPLLLEQAEDRTKYTISISQIPLSAKSPRYQGLTGQIKKALEQKGKKVRFVEGKQMGLSSVQFTANQFAKKGTEILLITDQARTIIAQTLWVQDFKDWIKRDFGRPKADPVRGMLPPKLARMLITIANGLWQEANRKSQSAHLPSGRTNLLDPFCGEGTILQEGLAIGLHVIGSDIDAKAVNDAEDNVRWFSQQYYDRYPVLADQTWTVFKADVGSLSKKEIPQPVELIVTEPYLGPALRQQPTKSQLQSLKSTYLENFKKMLKTAQEFQLPGGIIAFIAPAVQKGKFSQSILTKSLLDSCENFGYTPIQGPFHYAREDAKIGRKIYFLRKV